MKYFQHEIYSRDDDRLFELIEIHGMTGYAAWWIILEELFKAEDNGYQIEATDRFFKKLSKQMNIADWRVWIRLMDTMASVDLIDNQLWQEKTIFSAIIKSHADAYIRKKLANARRQAAYRDRQSQKNNTSHSEGNASVTHHFSLRNDVTPPYAEADPETDPKADPDPKADLDPHTISRETSGRSPTTKTQNPGAKSTASAARGSQARGEKPLYTEPFEQWWREYYQFALAVSCEPGRKAQAFTEWQKLLDEADCLAAIVEGSKYYYFAKQAQFEAKGEAIAVSHGCRYLRDRKWQQALDHQQQSKVPLKRLDAREIPPTEIPNTRGEIAALETGGFDQPQPPDAEFEPREETHFPPPDGIPIKSAMPSDHTGEPFRRDLPQWRSGWEPNDWDEGFIQFLLRHWLAKMPYYQQQGGVTRSHAISWLRKRDRNEALHPAILDAYQAMENAQIQRQQTEQQILASVSCEAPSPPEPPPTLTLADHAARLTAKLLITNARRDVEAEIDRDFPGQLLLVEQGDKAHIVLIGQEVAA